MPPSAIYRLYAQCRWSCAPRSSVPAKRKHWMLRDWGRPFYVSQEPGPALGLGAAISTSFAGAGLIQAASHAQEIGGALTAVWANTGEDKVAQEEIRSKSAGVAFHLARPGFGLGEVLRFIDQI